MLQNTVCSHWNRWEKRETLEKIQKSTVLLCSGAEILCVWGEDRNHIAGSVLLFAFVLTEVAEMVAASLGSKHGWVFVGTSDSSGEVCCATLMAFKQMICLASPNSEWELEKQAGSRHHNLLLCAPFPYGGLSEHSEMRQTCLVSLLPITVAGRLQLLNRWDLVAARFFQAESKWGVQAMHACLQWVVKLLSSHLYLGEWLFLSTPVANVVLQTLKNNNSFSCGGCWQQLRCIYHSSALPAHLHEHSWGYYIQCYRHKRFLRYKVSLGLS